jgi:hypothetical protein
LADFGLSKRIRASSNFQSKLFSRQRNNNQIYSLNEKSDVYSVDVLLWEISSSQSPFYAEGDYDVGETVVPNMPEEYVKIYTSK